MKKKMYLLFAGVLAAALISCGSKKEAESTAVIESTTVAESTTAAESTAAEEETGNVTVDHSATVSEFFESNGIKNEPGSPDSMEKAYIPDNLEKAIIGQDDRVTINNTTAFPYSAIGLLHCTGKCGCSWQGSGFMVSRRMMMTAAHCLVCSEHHVLVRDMDIYFGYQNNNNYYYRYDGGSHIWAATDSPQANREADFGYVLFDQPVGDRVGAFGTAAVYDGELESSWLIASGYRDGVLKACYGLARKQGDNMFTIDADWVSGNSGGPIYNDNYYVVGIIVAHSDNPPTNYARRITPDLVNMVQ